MAAARTWETGPWPRNFVSAAQVEKIAAAAHEALDGAVLSREELAAAVVERSGDGSLAGPLESGWGAVLKPLAWQGVLVYGPNSDDSRVTFTRPDTYVPGWAGPPAAGDAARVVRARPADGVTLFAEQGAVPARGIAAERRRVS